MRALQFIGIVWGLSICPPLLASEDCRPAPVGVAKLAEIRPGFHAVEGELAEFNPCHRSAQLSMPSFFSEKLAEKPPVFIIVHGGGGFGAGEKEMVKKLNSVGIATLGFDAYEMNGFDYKGSMLFVTGVANHGRQKMILKAAIGAYQWLLKQPGVDTTRIFVHGVSNGGSVAVNLAGLLDPMHVKGIFPEGASPTGLGLPDEIKVPVRMVFGKLDNYGGKTRDDWMYTRSDPCDLNLAYDLAPPGTSQRCSKDINPDQLIISPLKWVEQIRSKGQNIDVWFYEHAAHGIMAAPQINKGMRTYGKGPTAKQRFGWVGASRDAQEKLLADMLNYVKATY